MFSCPSTNPSKKYRSVLCNHVKEPQCSPVPTCIAKCDSAASKHYWRNADIAVTTNVLPFQGTPVTLPDSNAINPKYKCTIPLGPAFSKKATTATNLPQLKTASLVAVGPLCDDDKLVIFDNKIVRDVQPNPTLRSAINSVDK